MQKNLQLELANTSPQKNRYSRRMHSNLLQVKNFRLHLFLKPSYRLRHGTGGDGQLVRSNSARPSLPVQRHCHRDDVLKRHHERGLTGGLVRYDLLTVDQGLSVKTIPCRCKESGFAITVHVSVKRKPVRASLHRFLTLSLLCLGFTLCLG